MATVLSVLSFLSALLCTLFAQDPGFLTKFANFSQLNPSPLYELYWNVTGNRITFAVRVQTTGWVGLGISPTGLMLNSDVVMGFVDDTTSKAILNVSCYSIILICRPPLYVKYMMCIHTQLLF